MEAFSRPLHCLEASVLVWVMRLRLYVVVVSLDTHSTVNIFGDQMDKTEMKTKEGLNRGRLFKYTGILDRGTHENKKPDFIFIETFVHWAVRKEGRPAKQVLVVSLLVSKRDSASFTCHIGNTTFWKCYAQSFWFSRNECELHLSRHKLKGWIDTWLLESSKSSERGKNVDVLKGNDIVDVQEVDDEKERPEIVVLLRKTQTRKDIKCWVLLVNLVNGVSDKIDSWSRNKFSRKYPKQRFQNDFRLVNLFLRVPGSWIPVYKPIAFKI